MSQEHSVSRRASLRSLGVAGAALVLGGPAASGRAEHRSAANDQDKPPVDAVDVATNRFVKGHS